MSRSRVSYQFIGLTLLAVFSYYIGSFLLVIVRSKGGELDPGTTLELSWRLFFQNFPSFARNLYQNFFGYFEQYGKLYNASNLFLIPLDIITKLIVVGYFLLFWMPFDRQKCYRIGFFSPEYPYLSDDLKKKIDAEVKVEEEQKITTIRQSLSQQQPTHTTLHPVYSTNPYHRAHLLRTQGVITTPQYHLEEVDADIDDDEDMSMLPFEDIHKPLEQIYEKHEDLIYDIVRRRILPGSNILLVGYFSTLFIVDYGQFWTVPVYILGVMSMFWCMQSFLMIIDYLKFGPSMDL
jgi:hypothetical protein